MVSLLKNFQAAAGDVVFLPVMSVFALFLSIKLIPIATDMMVNAAAGLAGKHLGRQYRTLVINCSTNNPEVATMVISLLFVGGVNRYGGIGTPLGSNLANIYLIFIVALIWAVGRLWFKNRHEFHKLRKLVVAERKLVLWHLLISVFMFLIAVTAVWVVFQQSEVTELAKPPSKTRLFLAGCLCLSGVGFYVWREAVLRRKRPELFEDIDEDEHVASWKVFVIGTMGLIVCCYLLNVMFQVASDLYSPFLSKLFGVAVFAMLHFFLGALVTSLPEMNVAVSNYQRVESPDLNTALASASASNMSNLAIAGIGCMVALLF